MGSLALADLGLMAASAYGVLASLADHLAQSEYPLVRNSPVPWTAVGIKWF